MHMFVDLRLRYLSQLMGPLIAESQDVLRRALEQFYRCGLESGHHHFWLALEDGYPVGTASIETLKETGDRSDMYGEQDHGIFVYAIPTIIKEEILNQLFQRALDLKKKLSLNPKNLEKMAKLEMKLHSRDSFTITYEGDHSHASDSPLPFGMC